MVYRVVTEIGMNYWEMNWNEGGKYWLSMHKCTNNTHLYMIIVFWKKQIEILIFSSAPAQLSDQSVWAGTRQWVWKCHSQRDLVLSKSELIRRKRMNFCRSRNAKTCQISMWLSSSKFCSKTTTCRRAGLSRRDCNYSRSASGCWLINLQVFFFRK